MKYNLTFSFLFALFITAGFAVSTLDSIWEVDESCIDRRKDLNIAFRAVRELVIAARRDLFRIQEKKTDRKISGPLNSTNWDRIARNMAVTFGLEPPADPFQNGYDTENEHFKQVNYTIGRLWGGIVQGYALPEQGFSTKLRKLNKKPLIMCGDKTWSYYNRKANDPYDKSKTIEQVFPKVTEQWKNDRGEYEDKFGGAWIYKSRYVEGNETLTIGEETHTGPLICPAGKLGVTQQKLDMITFCDGVFAFSPNQSAVHNASDIKVGTDIDNSGIATQSLARVMLHEFAHYYGTKAPANENEELRDSDKLSDKNAVDKNGCVVYWIPEANGGRGEFVRGNPGGRKPSKVYGMAFVASIARDQSKNPNWGKFRRDRSRPNEWSPCPETNPTGPSVAPYTAETYAYFAMLSYLDKWDLTPDGKAKVLPK